MMENPIYLHHFDLRIKETILSVIVVNAHVLLTSSYLVVNNVSIDMKIYFE